MIKGTRSLELGEDPSFQRRSWRVQRIGWIVMLCFLLAGMLGLLGSAGPAVSASTGSVANGLRLDYARFLRTRSPIDLEITVLNGASSSNEVVIQIDRAYLEAFDIQSINPEPSDVQAGDGMLTYIFQLDDPGEETGITFNVEPEHYGYVEGEIGLKGLPPVEFWQFIYP